MDIEEIFEKYNDEFLEFERVVNPLHPRADLCGFLLLDKIAPGTNDMISASEHDEFFLDVDIEKFKAVATEEDVITLIRCGIRYSSEYDCFCMFA